MGMLARDRGILAVPTFTPASLSPLLWLSGDTLGSNGSGIATWTDQSTNGNNATQTTSGSRPVVATNVINGRSVARFTAASSHFMSLAGVTLGGSPPTFTIFVVHQTSGDGCFLGATGRQIRVGESGGNTLATFDGSSNPISGTLTAARTAWNIVEYVNTGSGSGNAQFFEAGTALTSAAGLAVATTLTLVGATNGGTVLNLNGDVASILVWGSALSSSDRSNVRKYLGSRYGIAVV